MLCQPWPWPASQWKLEIPRKVQMWDDTLAGAYGLDPHQE